MRRGLCKKIGGWNLSIEDALSRGISLAQQDTAQQQSMQNMGTFQESQQAGYTQDQGGVPDTVPDTGVALPQNAPPQASPVTTSDDEAACKLRDGYTWSTSINTCVRNINYNGCIERAEFWDPKANNGKGACSRAWPVCDQTWYDNDLNDGKCIANKALIDQCLAGFDGLPSVDVTGWTPAQVMTWRANQYRLRDEVVKAYAAAAVKTLNEGGVAVKGVKPSAGSRIYGSEQKWQDNIEAVFKDGWTEEQVWNWGKSTEYVFAPDYLKYLKDKFQSIKTTIGQRPGRMQGPMEGDTSEFGTFYDTSFCKPQIDHYYTAASGCQPIPQGEIKREGTGVWVKLVKPEPPGEAPVAPERTEDPDPIPLPDPLPADPGTAPVASGEKPVAPVASGEAPVAKQAPVEPKPIENADIKMKALFDMAAELKIDPAKYDTYQLFGEAINKEIQDNYKKAYLPIYSIGKKFGYDIKGMYWDVGNAASDYNKEIGRQMAEFGKAYDEYLAADIAYKAYTNRLK